MVFEKIRQLIADQLEIDPEQITMETALHSILEQGTCYEKTSIGIAMHDVCYRTLLYITHFLMY